MSDKSNVTRFIFSPAKWLETFCAELDDYWKKEPQLTFVDSIEGALSMAVEIVHDLWFQQFECKS
jgi:hypothetical protein